MEYKLMEHAHLIRKEPQKLQILVIVKQIFDNFLNLDLLSFYFLFVRQNVETGCKDFSILEYWQKNSV